uniref:Uncharacterized protein n=1 Tax=Pyxicephalus adspersus TaxID=30357 RepID=A0AAV3AXT2_PYXAD|nr:TPA: hypothetical protein GDO54_000391 [Pyxicephalus adspersus]
MSACEKQNIVYLGQTVCYEVFHQGLQKCCSVTCILYIFLKITLCTKQFSSLDCGFDIPPCSQMASTKQMTYETVIPITLHNSFN